MASTALTTTTKKSSTVLKAPGKGSTATKTPKAASGATTVLRETPIGKEAKFKPEKPNTTASSAQAPKEAPAEKATPRSTSGKASITPEERHRMIRDAAYYRAERRGFVGGDPRQDWLDAENEIDQLLMKRR
jgi:hypothetical protein